MWGQDFLLLIVLEILPKGIKHKDENEEEIKIHIDPNN